MTVTFIKTEERFFRYKFGKSQTIVGWNRNYLPQKDDVIVLDGMRYRVLQRQFDSKDYVKLFITK